MWATSRRGVASWRAWGPGCRQPRQPVEELTSLLGRPSMFSRRCITTTRLLRKEKVAMVGSGNFGTALARLLGRNVLEQEDFDDEVRMWVFEEEVDGQKLTSIINTQRENVKYLPGARLTDNVVAVPELGEALRGATMVAFCLPHQFLKNMLPDLRRAAGDDLKALSAIKGMDFDENGVVLISDLIRDGLQVDTSVLMGANVADDMKNDQFCETTIGYTNRANGELWKRAFDCPAFRVGLVEDTAGVELCGALKNIVALAAGFCDGLGYGANTKAAIIRIGLVEMMEFCQAFYPGVKERTFFESCGVADLVTTCFAGRNRRCAAAFARGEAETFEDVEAKLLGGQKLQGASRGSSRCSAASTTSSTRASRQPASRS
eukprot:TRINITY_DN7237_c0_g1_i5.p1 TRINITY_DN7237_c0_g1~~TRINITY_DN7237_c0_g1_i5.p1  ORF type:complete len:376 (-),score=94.26 TRINITY_DN7237_c0_g1_i5:290-1417(-)